MQIPTWKNFSPTNKYPINMQKSIIIFTLSSLVIFLFVAATTVSVYDIKWYSPNSYYSIGFAVEVDTPAYTAAIGGLFPSPSTYWNPGGVSASGQLSTFDYPTNNHGFCLAMAKPSNYPHIIYKIVVDSLRRTPANKLVYKKIVEFEVLMTVNNNATITQDSFPVVPIAGGDTFMVANTGHMDPSTTNPGVSSFGFTQDTSGNYVSGISGTCGAVLDQEDVTTYVVEQEEDRIWKLEKMTAYPNPTSGHVNVAANWINSQTKWEVRDLQANLIATGTGTRVEIPESAPEGVYVVTAKSDQGHQSSRQILLRR